MIKNNIKVLIIYFLILIITFALLSGINNIDKNAQLNFNNIVAKIFFIFLYIILFILTGKALGTKEKPNSDFVAFVLVFFIGMITYLIGTLGGGFTLTENINVATLPGSIYLSPFIFINTILGIKFSLINFIIESIIVSIIIGLSVRRSRVKKLKKRRRIARKKDTEF